MTLPDLTNYPELHENLWARISELLQEAGTAEAAADRAAFDVTEHIRTRWGGRQMYLAKAKKQAEEPAETPALFDQGDPQPAPMSQAHLEALRIEVARILTVDHNLPALFVAPIVEMVRDEFSRSTYVARGVAFDLARRDQAIYLGWDGTTSGKMRLMEKYGIKTEGRFYQIIRQQEDEANPLLINE